MREQQKAAALLIGGELLTGRTQEKNLEVLAKGLGQKGIFLCEARIIPDDEAMIIEAVRSLSAQYDYVFTTGGIGPTHDDITSASVAKSFDVPMAENPEALAALVRHYKGFENMTEPRRRMAYLPVGSVVIPNAQTGAPGFRLRNVYVFAGVPRIMRLMFEHVLAQLPSGEPFVSEALTIKSGETRIAAFLTSLQESFPSVSIGSYPFLGADRSGTNVVFRSQDAEAIREASYALQGYLSEKGIFYDREGS